jgi:hypothetical protein
MASVREPRRFESAMPSVMALVNQVRRERFPILDGVTLTVDFAFAPTKDGVPTSADLTHQGHTAAALIRITPLKDRVSGLADAILRISSSWWEAHSEPERIALINHELKHLIPNGERDSHDRPILKMRKHDYHCAGFIDAIEEDQEHSPDLQNLAAVNKLLRERNLLQGQFWG